MKKAYYIVTTVLSGLFTAFVLFLIINFIIFFDLDGTVLGTGVFALVGAGFLAVSVFGLIKKTFVLSAVLAKIGILAIGAGMLVFTLMAYEHDLGLRPVSFSIISWIIGLAFIGAGIFVSFMIKNKNKRKTPNSDKLLASPIYSIIKEKDPAAIKVAGLVLFSHSYIIPSQAIRRQVPGVHDFQRTSHRIW